MEPFNRYLGFDVVVSKAVPDGQLYILGTNVVAVSQVTFDKLANKKQQKWYRKLWKKLRAWLERAEKGQGY